MPIDISGKSLLTEQKKIIGVPLGAKSRGVSNFKKYFDCERDFEIENFNYKTFSISRISINQLR